MTHVLGNVPAPFLRVECVSFERNELLVKLADGDHGIYAIDDYYRDGAKLPVGWDAALYEDRATHARFSIKGEGYEIPLGSNLGEIVELGGRH